MHCWFSFYIKGNVLPQVFISNFYPLMFWRKLRPDTRVRKWLTARDTSKSAFVHFPPLRESSYTHPQPRPFLLPSRLVTFANLPSHSNVPVTLSPLCHLSHNLSLNQIHTRQIPPSPTFHSGSPPPCTFLRPPTLPPARLQTRPATQTTNLVSTLHCGNNAATLLVASSTRIMPLRYVDKAFCNNFYVLIVSPIGFALFCANMSLTYCFHLSGKLSLHSN